MSELPSVVRVKRKRDVEPTADLFLEGPSQKRQQIWQFRLQQTHLGRDETPVAQADIQTPKETVPPIRQRHILAADGANSAATAHAQRREFRLLVDHLKTAQEGVPKAEGRKRKAQTEADIPTFVEATAKKRRFNDLSLFEPASTNTNEEKPATPLKRPGAGARVKNLPSTTASPQSAPKPQPDRLADALHRFALQEAANEAAHKEPREKPKVPYVPKTPVKRYKDRFPDAFAATHPLPSDNDVDMDMSDEEDYVYDTYVRTKEPVVPAAVDSADPASVQIGYIVITEEEQPYWETYFEDDDTDKEWDTDEEDENGRIEVVAQKKRYH